MGIDTKRGAGDQRAVVFALSDSEKRGVIGQHDIDGIYLISEGFTQYLQIEHISQLQFIQVREHLLCGHTGMPRQDGMRASSADRQRAAK